MARGAWRARPVPPAPHPRQRRRKLRRRRRRWRRGRLRGGCSNSIYRPQPPLSPPPRHVDAAHWPRGPSAARAARLRPLPLPPSLPPARLAPSRPRRPRPLPRAASRNPDRGRRVPRRARVALVRLEGRRARGGRAPGTCSARAVLNPHPPADGKPGGEGLTLGSLRSLSLGNRRPFGVGLGPGRVAGRARPRSLGTGSARASPKRARARVLGSPPRLPPPGRSLHPNLSPSELPSGAKGRNSAVHFPHGQNPSSVASRTPHPTPRAERATECKYQPFPSGFCSLPEEIPLRGRKGGLFLRAHTAFNACLHRSHRLCYCNC